ncbi:MAG: signal peptidase II [bacterium]|nr:signal peptidase II [bacterium]
MKFLSKYLSRFLIVIFLVSLHIGCDQSTKKIAKKELQHKGTVQLVDNFFVLKYAENKGAFLSMFSKLSKNMRTLLLMILPLIVLVILSGYIIFNKNLTFPEIFAFCCIIGGGGGNLVDRIYNGYVIDFMNLGIGSNFRTGIFNFADLSIMLGTALILLHLVRTRDEQVKIRLPRD